MKPLDELIERLERGEFVNHNGQLAAAIKDVRVTNMLEHHNREATRRRNELVARLTKVRDKT
jgi:hypothetical protein